MRFFILDEADRLLDTGNKDAILQMFRSFPKSGVGANRLQVLLFSATLHSPEVMELAQQICHNPILVDLKGKNSVPETVDHVLVRVNPSEDQSWLRQGSMVGLIVNVHRSIVIVPVPQSILASFIKSPIHNPGCLNFIGNNSERYKTDCLVAGSDRQLSCTGHSWATC